MSPSSTFNAILNTFREIVLSFDLGHPLSNNRNWKQNMGYVNYSQANGGVPLQICTSIRFCFLCLHTNQNRVFVLHSKVGLTDNIVGRWKLYWKVIIFAYITPFNYQAPLLSPEKEGDTSVGIQPPKKPSKKKDKDMKGGGKKGQDSNGSKGGKSDISGESPVPSGGRTALPPYLVLSSLVGVIASGGTPLVHLSLGPPHFLNTIVCSLNYAAVAVVVVAKPNIITYPISPRGGFKSICMCSSTTRG